MATAVETMRRRSAASRSPSCGRKESLAKAVANLLFVPRVSRSAYPIATCSGDITRPDHVALYPNRACSMFGSSTAKT